MSDEKLTMREVMLADCYEREMDQLRELLGEAKEALKKLSVYEQMTEFGLHRCYINVSDRVKDDYAKARAVLAKIETALEKKGENNE